MSWPMVKLSDVAQINPRRPKEIDGEQLVSFVAMAAASEDGKLLSEEIKVLDETKKGFTYFERGDVLLAKITPCFENGKCLRASQISKTVGFGSTEFHVLRANEEKLDSSYLFYMVWSKTFRFLGEHSMSGAAGQKRVSADFLKAYEIPLPPLEEQKRIAAILDKADSVRRKRQQAVNLADDFLRSVFLDMFGDPVTNPKGWEVKQLNDIATKITDGTHDTPSKVNEGVKFVTGKNIRPFKLDLTDLEYVTQTVHEEIYNRCNPEYGDLLLTNIGAGTGNACFNSLTEAFSMKNVALVKSSPDKLAGRFLEYLFNHEGFKSKLLGENSKGGAQKFLSLKVIREASIPVPTFEEQLKFSALVEKVKNGNLLDPNLSLKNRELFNSLSQKAFAGEL